MSLVRTFTGNSMEEAYAQARRTLGSDALIVSEGKRRQGNWLTRWFQAPVFEVTAVRTRSSRDSFASYSGSFTPPGSLTPSQGVPRMRRLGSEPPPSPDAAFPSAPPARPGVAPSRPPPRAAAPASVPPPRPASTPAVQVQVLAPQPQPQPQPQSPPPAAAPAAQARAAAPAGQGAAPPQAEPELKQSVDELKARVDELAELKTMLKTVLARSTELAPAAPSETQAAVAAVRRMPPPARMPEALKGLLDGLREARIDSSVRSMIKDAVRKDLDEAELADPAKVYEAAVKALGALVKVGPGLRAHEGASKPRIIVLVGPTGVGKTTTLAKLAAGFQFDRRQRVAFVTLDTFRIGAPEQLKQYAEIIDIPLKVVFKPGDLDAALQTFSDRDVILVDTVGRSHRNQEDIEDLARYLSSLPEAEVCLVMAANTKQDDLVFAAKAFRPLGVAGLIMTKLDETGSYGEMLNVLVKEQLPLHFVTTGQGVPDDIKAADPRTVAKLVVPVPGKDAEVSAPAEVAAPAPDRAQDSAAVFGPLPPPSAGGDEAGAPSIAAAA